MATLLNPFLRADDANGNPISGGQLAVFEAGTTTPVTTYSDRALTTPQARPLIANSAGEFAQSFVASGIYKIRVSDADGVTLYENDNVRIADRPDDPVFLDNFAALDADATAYAEDTFLHVQEIDQKYKVAASGASDHHLTTSQGLKLYVIPSNDGAYNVLAWGVDNTGATDTQAELASVRAFVAGQTIAPAIAFPSGIYSYSVSPNWGVENAKYIFHGEVRLRYTGTGNAVILDGGASGVGIYNCRFGDSGRPKIECPSTAGHAIFARAYQLGLIRAQIMGAGSSKAGLKTEWLVSTDIDVRCSVNDEGWYLSSKPAIGIDLGQRGAGEQTSYCNIINPDCSGPNIGIQHTSTLGNNIFGGAMQGCIYAASQASVHRW